MAANCRQSWWATTKELPRCQSQRDVRETGRHEPPHSEWSSEGQPKESRLPMGSTSRECLAIHPQLFIPVTRSKNNNRAWGSKRRLLLAHSATILALSPWIPELGLPHAQLTGLCWRHPHSSTISASPRRSRAGLSAYNANRYLSLGLRSLRADDRLLARERSRPVVGGEIFIDLSSAMASS